MVEMRIRKTGGFTCTMLLCSLIFLPSCAMSDNQFSLRDSKQESPADLFASILRLTDGGDIRDPKSVESTFGVSFEIKGFQQGVIRSRPFKEYIFTDLTARPDSPIVNFYTRYIEDGTADNQDRRPLVEAEIKILQLDFALCIPNPIRNDLYTGRDISIYPNTLPSRSFILYNRGNTLIGLTVYPASEYGCVKELSLVQQQLSGA